MTRPKGDFFKGPAVRLQSDFAFSTAVEIIEYYLRQAPAGQRSQILDVDDAGDATERDGLFICGFLAGKLSNCFLSSRVIGRYQAGERNEMAHK